MNSFQVNGSNNDTTQELVVKETKGEKNGSMIEHESPWLIKTIYRHREKFCRVENEASCQNNVININGAYRRDSSNMKCCKYKCVDVSSNRYNCGQCGVKCFFGWKCCNGVCAHLKSDIYNCGRCNYACSRGARCFFGMCDYP
ncbi:hypothetical protein SUGI_0419970 [Cryptomeria japonica]|nr:hypothetical protein SUGI_0419970 [Cryptomeria japonica]